MTDSKAMSHRRALLALIGWLAVTLLAAVAGSLASAGSQEFYQELERPTWAPPGWMFGFVWSVLYCLMALAAWTVWRHKGWAGARPALALYVVQLAFNGLWSWLFFSWRLGALSMLNISVLLVLVVITLILFWRHRWSAGVMLVPYALWLVLAAALNWTIWQRNPELLG